jgi:hypothetical protein
MDQKLRAAVFDIGAGIIGLISISYIYAGDNQDRQFDIASAIIGLAEETAFLYLREHDPIAPQLETLADRVGFVATGTMQRRLLTGQVPSQYSWSIGHCIGIIIYRIVFGILIDLPASRLQKWGWL